MAKRVIDWPDEADAATTKILALHAKSLREEAQRVAERSKASSVSEHYVPSAADHLRLGPTIKRRWELAKTAGTGFMGLSGGVLGGGMLDNNGAHTLDTPFELATGLVGVVGVALFVAGFMGSSSR